MATNPSTFLEYSLCNIQFWSALVGQKIKHSVFGSGIIKEMRLGDSIDNSSAIVQLDQPVASVGSGMTDIKKIGLRAFNGQIITELSLPVGLLEKVNTFEKEKIQRDLERQQREAERSRREQLEREQWEREEAERQEQLEREANARNEFRLRKEKYQVTSFKETSPLSDLNKILIKLDDGNILSDYDEQWLKSNGLFSVIAIYYERIGNLATAGSNWRKVDNPHRALEITDSIVKPNHYVLTMRGGAFRDISDFDHAKECALSALQLAPDDFHPYNLLGAIYYQQGLPEEGNKYFEKANALGSKPHDEDTIIRSALKKAEKQAKKNVAKYLMAKDPVRYEWAKYYLK